MVHSNSSPHVVCFGGFISVAWVKRIACTLTNEQRIPIPNNMKKPNHNINKLSLAALIMLAALLICTSCATSKDEVIVRESYQGNMEGVWIATVKNIDWPSSLEMSEAEQKAEIKGIIERCAEIGIRDIIFQVKPAQETFYKSDILPYSQYLIGQYTNEYPYDPLEYVLELTHKNNMRLHAWINPFRIMDKEALLEYGNGIKEEWIVEYGQYHWINPTIDEAREFVINCVMEIVDNYDIDGLHLDDYFYPYPVKDLEFDDESQYEKRKKKSQSKDDFRRASIDEFIYKLADTIKSAKPYVAFGISPFAVWRNDKDDPKGSPTSAFVSSYDTLYADTRKWYFDGIVDYMAPQIYFDNSNKYVTFDNIFGWWEEQSKNSDTPLYIGLPAYLILEKYSKTYTLDTYKEFYNIVSTNENVDGVIHYSVQYLVDDELGLGEFLEEAIAENTSDDESNN